MKTIRNANARAVLLTLVLSRMALPAQTLDPWETADQFSDPFDGAAGYCITVDPLGSILAGGSAGWYGGSTSHFIIRKSTDGVATFSTLTDMAVGSYPNILATDPAGNLYANATGGQTPGILKSTDGGTTWSVIAPSVRALVVAPDGTIFTATAEASGNWLTKRSLDGGLTWAVIDNYKPRYNAGPNAIALDQQGNIYVAGQEVSNLGAKLLVRRGSNTGGFLTVDTWKPSKGVAGAFALATDANGQVYVAGYARDGSPKTPVYHFIVRKSITGAGAFWTVDDLPASSGDARATSIAVDSMNCVYVTGYVGASNWTTRKAADGVHFSTSDVVPGGWPRGLATSGLNVFVCGSAPVSGNNTLLVRRLSP